MNEMKLEILTPEKCVADVNISSLYLEGSMGRLGILPGHTALISQLEFGLLEMETNSGKEKMLCGKGLVEVAHDKVTVLVRSAESGKDIDVERAKAALTRAKSRRDSKDKDVDMTRAELALYRAIQRMSFVGGK